MKVEAEAIYQSLPLQMVTLAPPPMIADTDDLDSAMPAEMRNWLVRLRLLEGVPFANLVADTELLPEESIRWFYLDRQWTDALVQGRLVGRHREQRRPHPSRRRLSRDPRRARQRGTQRAATPGTARFGGKVDAISGFVLRSAAVSGWPGLHVRAFKVEPNRGRQRPLPARTTRTGMRLLRLERLAPAVLLCLFDGIPTRRAHRGAPPGRAVRLRRADAQTTRSAMLKPRDKDDLQ